MTSLTYAVESVRDLVADDGSNPGVIHGPATWRVESEPRGLHVTLQNLHSTYLLLKFLSAEERHFHHTGRKRWKTEIVSHLGNSEFKQNSGAAGIV